MYRMFTLFLFIIIKGFNIPIRGWQGYTKTIMTRKECDEFDRLSNDSVGGIVLQQRQQNCVYTRIYIRTLSSL